jgi:hypothetical protein
VHQHSPVRKGRPTCVEGTADPLRIMTTTQFDEAGWPINPPGVGMGPNTAWKLHEYRTIVRAEAALVGNINIRRMRKGKSPYPFCGLDPTSGPGGYIQRRRGEPDRKLISTSLQLADACHERGLDYRLGFIEVQTDWVRALQRRLAEGAAHGRIDLSRVQVMEGRYEDLARSWVVDHVPEYGARGLITPDANGEFGYRTLYELGRLPQLKCVDFAIHASGSLLKWHQSRGMYQLEDALAACQKTHWLVGQIRENWQWVWLFGTNWADFPEMRKINLVSVDTEEGQARLKKLCTTKSERLKTEQPPLMPDEG